MISPISMWQSEKTGCGVCHVLGLGEVEWLVVGSARNKSCRLSLISGSQTRTTGIGRTLHNLVDSFCKLHNLPDKFIIGVPIVNLQKCANQIIVIRINQAAQLLLANIGLHYTKLNKK